MPESLQRMLYRRLDEAPEGRALAWYSSAGDYRWTTFEALMARASGPAAHLADAGVRAGDVCIIVLPSEDAAAMLLLAVLQLGAVPLLVAPPVMRGTHETLLQTLRHTVRRTQARVVILPNTLSSLIERLPAKASRRYLIGEHIIRSDGAATAAEVRRVTPAESDIVAMQLTSGTTGRPRVCVWSHRNVLTGLTGMWAAMGLRSDDVCFNWTPLYHDMGLVNNFLLCLTHRVPLVMMNPFDFVKRPGTWLRGLAATGSTVTWSPNFGFAIAAERASEGDLAGVRLDGVRAFWSAAERVHVETMRAFHARFAPYGVRSEALRTNFGCAENVGGATFTAAGEAFPIEFVDRESLLERRVAMPVDAAGPGTVAVVGVGQPYPNMRIHILSPRGKPLPDGHVGEVALDTPSRMMGYLGDTAATRRAFSHGLLRTGDLGYLRGQELFWVGRVKERITVRGRKLDPSDFEPVLLRIPGLRQGSFAAFGVEDAARGTQRVVIVAEVRDPPGRTHAEIVGDISREVFLHLGVTADEILLVRPGTLTKTSSGKRRHRFFRRQYLSGGLGSFLFEESRAGRS